MLSECWMACIWLLSEGEDISVLAEMCISGMGRAEGWARLLHTSCMAFGCTIKNDWAAFAIQRLSSLIAHGEQTLLAPARPVQRQSGCEENLYGRAPLDSKSSVYQPDCSSCCCCSTGTWDTRISFRQCPRWHTKSTDTRTPWHAWSISSCSASGGKKV